MNIVELEDGSLLCGKDFNAEVTVAEKGMVAMVSTENVDTDGDIVRQGKTKGGDGWLLSAFNANPIITWSHDRLTIPNIGAASVKAKVQKSDDGSRALFLDPFAFDMADPFAAGIAGKYERKVLKQTSVGFIGLKWKPIESADTGNMTGREYYEQKLIEVACVNVGANQDTNTIVKRMLGRVGIAAKVQDAGDGEVRELKGLIQHLTEEQDYFRRELTMLANVMKRLGDKESAGHDAAAVISGTAKQADHDMDAAATAILLRLKTMGLAQ